MRVLPKSLGGQLVALLIGALVVAQGVSFLLFTGDREDAVRVANRAGLLGNMASVVRVLASSPKDTRPALAVAATSPRIRYWISNNSAVEKADPGLEATNAPFDRMFQMQLREPPRIALVDDKGKQTRGSHDGPKHGPGRDHPYADPDYDVRASVPFPDGGWLNAQTRIRAEQVPFPWPTVISALLMAAAILLIIGFTVRRVTLPLAALAKSVEAFGLGGPSKPLPETGPNEVRRLTSAFNRMQDRLERFIADRTRMLAAIGHDLRTPITSLKLRAELLDDEEARTRMSATLDDMQRMTEATLAFARDDAAAESARQVDLEALIESVVDDQSTLGHQVTFTGGGRLAYSCRPTAIKRAIGNVLENAVRYGKRARVTLADTKAGPIITVDDDGPGIPADRFEEVFKPFVRLETSRSRETGGVGLGLSIARSIILGHGGGMTLSNRAEGGLRVEIRLPPPAAQTA
ncbi:ATP-binding protein [Bauldia litoralis]|uniref:ATP-binding protein n=1 Tax=Bauldia litoralis TaxID=665467 RepID=UPI003267FBB0